MNTYPRDAERVDFSQVCKLKPKPSLFVPGMTALVSVIECPACHTEHPDPGFDHTIKCDCGLSMLAVGCMVFIWRDLPLAAE